MTDFLGGPIGWLVLDAVNITVVLYFLTLNSVYLITSIFAFRALKRYALRLKTVDVEELVAYAGVPPVTLVVPAFNEEATCVESTRSLLMLRYPEYEIVIVDDGSKDGTLDRLKESYGLIEAARATTASLPSMPIHGIWKSKQHPNLWVISKENGGKADALNAGLNFCHTPLFCAIDADSLLERDALTRIARAFMEEASTVAAGGIIRIVNGCEVRDGVVNRIGLPRSRLARFQVIEYLRAFLSGRMGWDAVQSTLIISGAFGMFRRSVVVEAGGYSTETVGEDMELVVRLHRHCREKGRRYRVAFIPDPVAWTECPETIRVLARQRDRWQRGLIESLMRHRKMLLNPRYGRIGLVAYPYFFFLEMCGPLVEALGYVSFTLTVILGRASLFYVSAFLSVAVAFGVALSIAAVGLEELTFRRYPRFRDILTLLLLSVFENIGYRQLSTYWRVRGTFSKLRGKTKWGSMDRKGFRRIAPTPTE